ncbi:MAG: V-type ATP synthase subunit K [Armatimonadota bacterium]|nr:V-type ATP synthase subunit K [Armatimonadota bacterium]
MTSLKTVLLALMLTLVALTVASPALAAETPAEGARQITMAHGLMALAAALAVFGGAIGTAWAQSRIGSAAAGAMAERPEIGGQMLIFLVLPETLIIFGFLVAFFIVGRL